VADEGQGPPPGDSPAPDGRRPRQPGGRLGLNPTPDTGERLSPVRLWDEATRPAGPDPPADAVYTARGRMIGAHLIEVHNHLRAELARVRDLVRQVREGEADAAGARSAINEMTMRHNDWALGAYCASYCRFVAGHHMLEDEAVFPHLRASEAALGPVVDRLTDEHTCRLPGGPVRTPQPGIACGSRPRSWNMITWSRHCIAVCAPTCAFASVTLN